MANIQNRKTHSGRKVVVAYGKKFVLEFGPKVHQAIHGDESNPHAQDKGVGLDAKPEALLAAYDRLGGFISLGGKKIKMGTFWDFRRSAPVAKPEVAFQARPKAKSDTLENAGDANKKDVYKKENDEEDPDEESEDEAGEAEEDETENVDDEQSDEEVDADDDNEDEDAGAAKPKAAKKK